MGQAARATHEGSSSGEALATGSVASWAARVVMLMTTLVGWIDRPQQIQCNRKTYSQGGVVFLFWAGRRNFELLLSGASPAPHLHANQPNKDAIALPPRICQEQQ